MGSSKRLVARMDESSSETSPQPTKRQKIVSERKATAEQNRNDDSHEAQKFLENRAKCATKHQEIRDTIALRDDELVNPASDLIEHVLTDTNDILREAGVTADVRLLGDNTRIVRILTEKVSKQASNIGEASQRINSTVLSNNLKNWFPDSNVPSAVNFAQIGLEVKVFFRSIPSFDCMLGPLDLKLAPKKEKVKRERTVAKNVVAEKPKEINAAAAGKGEAEEVDQFMLHKELQQEMFKGLESKPTNFFEAVVDPKSFTQTVENIFAMTFLVKDKLVALQANGDMPVARAIRGELNPLFQTKDGQSAVVPPDTQFVAVFSYEDYERMMTEYTTQKTMMKHRVEAIYDDAKLAKLSKANGTKN